MNPSRTLVVLRLIAGALALLAAVIPPAMAKLVQPYYLGIDAAFGKWPNGQVSIAYNPANAPALSFDQATVEQLIQDAAAEWEGVCGVKFTYQGITSAAIDNSDDGVVVVGWTTLSDGAAGQGGPYWIPSSGVEQTANGGIDAYLDGSIKLSTTVSWDRGRADIDAAYLKDVLVHELGHVLGLGHTNNPESIMYANPYNHLSYPRQDDIDGAQALYGPPRTMATLPVYTPPSAGTWADLLDFGWTVDTQNATPLTTLNDGEAAASVYPFIQYRNYTGPLDFVITDPSGVRYQWDTYGFSCDVQYASCTSWSYGVDVPSISTVPGTWTFYIIKDGVTVAQSALNVQTTPIWHPAPDAQLTLDAIGGLGPLTVNAQVDIPSGDTSTVQLIWHVPGTGEITTTYAAGSQQTLTFNSAGSIPIYVEVNDDATRYTGAGAGFQKLLGTTLRVSATTPVPLDLDGDGRAAAATDGMFMLHYLFGFRDPASFAGAIGTGSALTVDALKTNLERAVNAGQLDVDGDGTTNALTDGMLILRYLSGFTNQRLVGGAVPSGAARADPLTIQDYLNNLTF